MKTLRTLMGAAAITLAASSPSWAIRAQDHTVRNIGRDIVNQLEDFYGDLLDAMRQQQGEASSYVDKGIESQKRMLDSSEINATDRERQLIRAQAESGMFDPGPNTCLMVDLMLRAQDEPERPNEGQGTLAVGRVLQEQSTNTAPPAEGARTTLDNIEPLNTDDYQVADPTTDMTYLFAGSTLDLADPAISKAINALLRNAVNPIPEIALTAEDLKNPELVAEAAARQGRNARANAALQSVAMFVNMLEPRAPKDIYMEYLKGVDYNRPLPGDKVSELTQLEMKVLGYYGDTDRIGKTDPGSAVKDMLQLMAVMARMQYLSLEMQNRQALMQSMQLLDATYGSQR